MNLFDEAAEAWIAHKNENDIPIREYAKLRLSFMGGYMAGVKRERAVRKL